MQKRIQLKYGTATVSEDCSQKTIDALNELAEIAYNMDAKMMRFNGVKIGINPKPQQLTPTK